MSAVPAYRPPSVHHCPACQRRVERFGEGGSVDRRRSRCPHCAALERHRFLALLLDMLSPTLDPSATIVEVAPTDIVSRLLEDLDSERLLRLDFDPGADGRAVDVQASLTDLPLADASVDLLVCYHVLEHVPDDAKAMAEVARVLTPSGIALMQVPYRFDEPTDEDPDADEDERIRRFGQADHVRWYGHDLEARLEAAGLVGHRMRPLHVLGQTAAEYFWTRNSPVWVLRPRTAGPRAVQGLEVRPLRVLPLLVDRLLELEDERREAKSREQQLRGELDRLRGERDRVRDQRDTLRTRNERITSHPVVRAAARVRRAVTRS